MHPHWQDSSSFIRRIDVVLNKRVSISKQYLFKSTLLSILLLTSHSIKYYITGNKIKFISINHSSHFSYVLQPNYTVLLITLKICRLTNTRKVCKVIILWNVSILTNFSHPSRSQVFPILRSLKFSSFIFSVILPLFVIDYWIFCKHSFSFKKILNWNSQ